jgi:hypothetical protein
MYSDAAFQKKIRHFSALYHREKHLLYAPEWVECEEGELMNLKVVPCKGGDLR